jgi:hypothetical protein
MSNGMFCDNFATLSWAFRDMSCHLLTAVFNVVGDL